MNYLSVITDTQQRKVWWRAFRIWQRKPHELAPLKEQAHVCASCRTSFTGNYCPRCGQSAKIGRFSFKKALLLFLDVWGLGNRGMFRSIRDLVLRPGYMIRDYISGMQSAYFPPFKMFFLLSALSLVIEHGFGLTEEGEEAQQEMSKAEIAKKELAKEGIDDALHRVVARRLEQDPRAHPSADPRREFDDADIAFHDSRLVEERRVA